MIKIKKLYNFSLDEKIGDYLVANLRYIKIIFIVFAINLLIYGQKIFFISMPADDYMRYGGDDNTKLLITNSARWAQALLNDNIFSGELQILPYIHTIIGILSFTLMGFLTMRYLKRDNNFELIVGSLLVSATPMFAHNLFFSTNITAWITLLFGLIGFMISYRKGILYKIVGFILLVVAIANYQTIIQMIMVIISIRLMIDLLSVKEIGDIKRAFLSAFWYTIFVLLAYVISYEINELFLSHYHWVHEHRLAKATSKMGLSLYIDRLSIVYSKLPEFHYLKSWFVNLYSCIAIIIISGYIFTLSKRDIRVIPKVISLLLALLLIASIPIIINLPLLIGVDIPPRAHFTIGWVVGGFFVIGVLTLSGIFRSILYMLSIAIIIASAYYITLFFTFANKQTTMDILRANTIVERIRTHKNYKKEPIGFYVAGVSKFDIPEWHLKFEEPFSTHWAKHKIFKHFTDLNFHQLNQEDISELEHYIVENYSEIYPYPGKNSVVVYKDKAIVFLRADYIAHELNKNIYLSQFPDKEADINATFDIFIKDNLIFYKKSPCTDDDTKISFFLRVYRDYKNSTINKKAQPERFDFDFVNAGEIKDNECRAVVVLPKYDIYKIYTGQFISGRKIVWESTYYYNKKEEDK